MKFQCKICKTEWILSRFVQVDEIQSIQCSLGHPHQCHVLKAVIE